MTAPDRCPGCDAEDWCATTPSSRVCRTCGWQERRCRTGHWSSPGSLGFQGFCRPCLIRRAQHHGTEAS